MSSIVKVTVLRVNVACQKCKKKLFIALTGLSGVDKVEINAANGTVTITSTAEPFEVIVRAKKTKTLLGIVSVGAPPPPPPPSLTPSAPGGETEEPAQINIHTHVSCAVCDGPGCSIM